jgi:UDP-N-acetylmuramoyl-tripeptide--D-alanyl-D-alanine ligase
MYGLFMPLFFSFVLSHLFEWMQMQMYEKQAKGKIQLMPNLTIIAITASYGKTSIKNFLYHLLQQKYKVYKTPRSVNTKQGIIQDINNELSSDTQIYVVEAGARQKGDIAQIVDLLSPQICIVGKIGSQHIEYFKTLEAIRDTKMELVHSARLSYAIVHESANIKPAGNVSLFKESAVSDLISNLDGIGFSLEICGEKIALKAPILGAFNAQNIALACFVAKQLGITNEQLQKSVASLESVEHRLQKIEANGKIIIDDSFNGNLEGMLDSYALVKEFASQKVIITPGIVESTKEANITLAKAIDEVFDLVILPPSPNQALLASQIKSSRLIVLKNKEELQKALLEHTHIGDLILFSNDTPSYM